MRQHSGKATNRVGFAAGWSCTEGRSTLPTFFGPVTSSWDRVFQCSVSLQAQPNDQRALQPRSAALRSCSPSTAGEDLAEEDSWRATGTT